MVLKRYSPLLVGLHWVIAVMIIISLVMGFQILSETPNSDPEKISLLRVHMIVGVLILILTLFRLFVRLISRLPEEANIGNKTMNRIAKIAHYLFYVVVLLICASGIGIAFMANLPEIVFGSSGAQLPVSFDDFPPKKAHEFLTELLALLIIGHVLAFLYHQFIRRDGIFSRMWFGKRN